MKKILYILLFLPLIIFGQEQDPCYSINNVFNQISDENPALEINLVSGWNMIGYPCSQEIIISDAFSSIIENVIIVKNNNGSVFMPEYNYNGIGFLEGGQGYQIKMTDFVLGFTFCQSIQYPTLEGCIDCEAANFNQWANVDDGSCSYDSDGDGILDSLEIVGCQDATACDYNINATDLGGCSYPQDGYDCNGNLLPEIGSLMNGGIVFYIDETGEHGLVAGMEDLQGGSNYEWGCNGTDLNGNNSGVSPELQAIGTGYQNTLEIVSSCSETPIAASEALAHESGGYSDWYLPSFDELYEMYITIGQGATEGNIGGFDAGWYWSSSEYDVDYAWNVRFNDGYSNYPNKYYTRRVRVIRAF